MGLYSDLMDYKWDIASGNGIASGNRIYICVCVSIYICIACVVVIFPINGQD